MGSHSRPCKLAKINKSDSSIFGTFIIYPSLRKKFMESLKLKTRTESVKIEQIEFTTESAIEIELSSSSR